MTAQRGDLVLLAVGDAGGPETFSTLGGMRLTRLSVNNRPLDASHRASGVWRTLLGGSGLRAVTISGNGSFTASASEATLRTLALAGDARNWRVSFPAGGVLTGAFVVARYERRGEVASEEQYELTLESAGDITYT